MPQEMRRQERAEENLDREFVQIAREGFWMVDRHWCTVMVNPRLCELLGYPPEDMLGKSVFDFYFPEDHQTVRANLDGRERGKEDRYVVRYRRADGSELWAEISVKPIFDKEGQFDGGIAVLVDVGDKLKAERELQATRELLETSAEALNLGFWDADIETRHMVWTQQLEVLFGYAPGSYDGSFDSFYERIHPEDREHVRATYERSIETEEAYTLDYRVRTEDGGWRWIGARGRVIAGADGRHKRSVGAAVCIDEYKKLEVQLLQSQRLESLGHLVSSISHDFNNFLSTIGGYTELAQSTIDEDSEAANYLKIVEESVGRATELVKKLLMSATHRDSAPQCIDINMLTRGLKGFLASMMGGGVELVMDVDEAELYVRIDPVHFEQVIVNMAVNANHAMPDGGTLKISTGVRRGHQYEDELVVVSIEDSGTGMDSATMERIFDPLFTTKGPGKGTGLGLSTCYGIVKGANGQIVVTSEPGLGSKFEILLPRAQSATLPDCA